MDESSSNLNSEAEASSDATDKKQWQSLTRLQRRVAGVLIEKSKTTPDTYPMSLNGVKTASNQKSNRSPKMELEEHEVEEVLYQLRHLGAVVEVHSGGRVPKYKHQLYDWLGVNNVELAVLGELLLRGEQTLGELRSRASRMSKIEGLSELKPIFAGLIEKGLVVELTPAGRGQVVTHNLYQPEELERLQQQFEGGAPAPRTVSSSTATREVVSSESSASEEQITNLEQQVTQLNQTVEELRTQVDSMNSELAEIRRLLE